MPHIPESNDVADWHKYFAMEYNNRAWNLAANQSRSAEENAEMLDAAHAAAAHWKIVGTQLNIARAETLLAAVHSLLGLGKSAWALASSVRTYFAKESCPDWEQAYIHLIHAHAAYVDGRDAEHRASYQLAATALENIADAEDRVLVQASFDQVPVPD
ncbi:MAG: hypothetical protein ACR2PZ_17430 [Pseudomonadales bacterium]